MIRVLMKDGATAEVMDAVTAEVKGKEVVCYDRRGVIVARYPSDEVTLFGPHLPSVADMPADDDEPDAASAD
jgi:hypothetical protein